MSFVNKPKKIRVAVILILVLKQNNDNMTANIDDGLIRETLAANLGKMQATLNVDADLWTLPQGGIWSAFEAIETALDPESAPPTDTTLQTLSNNLATALG